MFPNLVINFLIFHLSKHLGHLPRFKLLVDRPNNISILNTLGVNSFLNSLCHGSPTTAIHRTCHKEQTPLATLLSTKANDPRKRHEDVLHKRFAHPTHNPVSPPLDQNICMHNSGVVVNHHDLPARAPRQPVKRNSSIRSPNGHESNRSSVPRFFKPNIVKW